MTSHHLIFCHHGEALIFEQYGADYLDSARTVGAKLAAVFSLVTIETVTDGAVVAVETCNPSR